jgi:DNA-binding transcriptional regulator YhcF (GntR family)
MPTGLVLSQGDGRPMYLQIVEQIRRHIALGDWPPGHALPSIRQLAVELNVSVITVKRAYFDLERDGVIATHHGKGSVVAEGNDLGAHIHQQELARHLTEAARLGQMLGLKPRELQSQLRDAIESEADALKERI